MLKKQYEGHVAATNKTTTWTKALTKYSHICKGNMWHLQLEKGSLYETSCNVNIEIVNRYYRLICYLLDICMRVPKC